jgi:hypothetical protein
LAAKLVAGHGVGIEREPWPGLPEAARARGWVPGWPGADGDLERSGNGGQTPARIIQRGPSPGTSRWSSPVRSRLPGRRKVRLPGASACLSRRHAE